MVMGLPQPMTKKALMEGSVQAAEITAVAGRGLGAASTEVAARRRLVSQRGGLRRIILDWSTVGVGW